MSPDLVIAIMLVPAWAYLIGTAGAVLRFTRLPLPTALDRPAISVLKPLHGDEPGLYENLRSFAEQDYPTAQIVLGVDGPHDTALPVARALIRGLPEQDIALVVDPRARGSNRKVANLENMLEAARYGILVLADSDMRVDRRYLGTVTAPLHDPLTGVVTCLYKAVSTGGKWSELGAQHINFGFLPSALVAEALGLGGGCFGATIALRRDSLERAGGFVRLRDELADDHRIGKEIRALGLAMVLSPYLVEARVSEPSFKGLWQHELRWARTVRAVAPAGFAGSVLAHPVALAALAAAVTGFGLTACILLGISWVLRWTTAQVIAKALGVSPPPKRGSFCCAMPCPLPCSSPAFSDGRSSGGIRLFTFRRAVA